MGCVFEATKATCLPSGLSDNTPESGPNVSRLIVAILTGSPPEIELWQLVIWLINPVGCKINLRAVPGPDRVFLVESTAGALSRPNLLLGAVRSWNQPKMRRMFRIEIAFVVHPVNSACNYANIAFVFRVLFAPLCVGATRARGRGFCAGIVGARRRFCRLTFLALVFFLFSQVLGICGTCEKDRFPIGRPCRIRGAFGQVCKDKGVASFHWQKCQLWFLSLAFLFLSAQEQQIIAVRRPSRRGIMFAGGELMRFLAAGERHRPDGRIVTILFLVNRDPHESHLRVIWGNLWVRNPDKIPEVLFRDVAFLSERAADSGKKEDASQECQTLGVEGAREDPMARRSRAGGWDLLHGHHIGL